MYVICSFRIHSFFHVFFCTSFPQNVREGNIKSLFCQDDENIFYVQLSVTSHGVCTDMKFLLQCPLPVYHAFFNSLHPLSLVVPGLSTSRRSTVYFFTLPFTLFFQFSVYFPVSLLLQATPSRNRILKCYGSNQTVLDIL